MNDVLHALEIVAKVIGWLTVIIGGIVAVLNFYRKMKKKLDALLDAITSQSGKIDKLTESDKLQHLSILRLTVMTDSIPLSERIAAGREYIAKGGNGDVKEYIETHLIPHDKIVREE